MNKIYFVNIFCFLVLVGCGKNIENSDKEAGSKETTRKPQVEIGREILDLELECEDPFSCAGHVGALFIKLESGEEKTCLGSLISKDEFLTSASCLPRSMRIPNLDCTNDAFVVLPKTPFEPEVKVSCSKVVRSDSNAYKEPALWKQDLVLLKLHETVERIVPDISFDGVLEEKDYLTWGLEKVNDNFYLLRKNNCQFVFDTYLNPYSNSSQSPMLVAKNCLFTDSDIGSPIYDDKGIVGIFSSFVDIRRRAYLLASDLLVSKDLDEFFHISNMACVNASELRNNLVSTRDLGDLISCDQQFTVRDLNYKRLKIFRNPVTHKKNFQSYKRELEKVEKFFRYDFKILGHSYNNDFTAYPYKATCIYDAETWVEDYRRGWNSILTYAEDEVVYPVWTFRTKLDENLRPVSTYTKGGELNFKVEFNPFGAYVREDTFANITYIHNGREVTVENNSVTEVCQ